MIDITNRNKNELSLIMFNDEYFYNELKYFTLDTKLNDKEIKSVIKYIKALLSEKFIYTNNQLKTALRDIQEYLKD